VRLVLTRRAGPRGGRRRCGAACCSAPAPSPPPSSARRRQSSIAAGIRSSRRCGGGSMRAAAAAQRAPRSTPAPHPVAAAPQRSIAQLGAASRSVHRTARLGTSMASVRMPAAPHRREARCRGTATGVVEQRQVGETVRALLSLQARASRLRERRRLCSLAAEARPVPLLAWASGDGADEHPAPLRHSASTQGQAGPTGAPPLLLLLSWRASEAPRRAPGCASSSHARRVRSLLLRGPLLAPRQPQQRRRISRRAAGALRCWADFRGRRGGDDDAGAAGARCAAPPPFFL
jgi:hypothetical protein